MSSAAARAWASRRAATATARTVAITGRTATARVVAGAGIARGMQYGESDATASSPKEKPVHPNDLLATIYYALGIDPDMEIRNHLNQPRELVKGKIVTDLFA